MPPSAATMFVSGCAALQSPHVDVTTPTCSRTTPCSNIGPVTAAPVNVSKTERLPKSYITLLERDMRPEVRRTGSANPSTLSVKNTCAEAVPSPGEAEEIGDEPGDPCVPRLAEGADIFGSHGIGEPFPDGVETAHPWILPDDGRCVTAGGPEFSRCFAFLPRCHSP